MGVLRRRRPAIALAGAAASALVALGLACGPGSIGDLTAGPPDAGIEATSPSEAAPPDAEACIHAAPPERPTTPDGPNVVDITFAITDLRLDTGIDNGDGGGLPPPKGLDLDRTCTCPEAPSCAPRVDAACDFPEGRDNVGGKLLATLAVLTSDGGTQNGFTDNIARGTFGILFSVQGWNGEADDPEVVFGMRIANGANRDADGGRNPPRFDGTDVWSVDPSSIVAGENLDGMDCRSLGVYCLPLATDPRAYVRGNVVVAHLDDVPLRFVSDNGPLVVNLRGATFTGTLTKVGASYALAGELAGRFPTDRLLTAMAAVRDGTNKSVCPPNPVYDFVKKAVCESADLAVDPARDRTSAPCDALSDAISFTALPAFAGPVVKKIQDSTDCPGFVDSCATR